VQAEPLGEEQGEEAHADGAARGRARVLVRWVGDINRQNRKIWVSSMVPRNEGPRE
jgi:hypothetical protein